MKKLLILLFLAFTPGCSAQFSNMVDAAMRQEPGWNFSGYVIKDNSKEIKLGFVSSEILYDLAGDLPRNRKMEEDTKNEGPMLGIFLKKSF